MKLFVLLSIGVIFLVISGCASPGQKSFDIGSSLEKSNRLEDAASLYEDAVTKEPQNEIYAAALGRVKAEMVSQHLRKARSILETKPFTYEIGRTARNSVDKALKLNPADAEAKKVSEEVAANMDLLVKQAETLYSEATKAIEGNDWLVALDTLKQITKFYPDYLDLAEKIKNTETAAVSWFLKEAEKAMAKEDLDSASSYLRKAADLQPKNSQIIALISDVSGKNSAAGYLTKAEGAIKSGDFVSGVAFAKKGLTLAKDTNSSTMLENTIDDAVFLSLDQASDSLKKNRLFLAYNELVATGSYLSTALKDQKFIELTGRLTTAIIQKGDTYETSGNIGNALIWYEKALNLNPANQEVAAKVSALRDQVRQRVIKKIAVMDFTSPSSNIDAGRIVTDTLLSYMTRNVSGDIKLLARDVLGTLLKEIELGQAGLYDIESAKKAGKLKGTDVFIFGSVLRYNIDKEKEEGMKRVSAVVGKKKISNPAYESWVKLNPSPSEEARQNAPQQLIEDELRETISYKVATHKKIANVSISFRIVDVVEGEVVVTKTLKRNKEVVDTYQEGVEFANIPYKELKLPSDSELLERVVDEIIEELSREVLVRFHNLQVANFNSAEKLRKKEAFEKAIEKYVDAIFVEEVKNVSTQVTEDSRKGIEQVLKTASF